MNEPERLMRRTGAPNELSHHTARAPRKTKIQEAEILETRAQTLEAHDGEVSENLDKEDIGFNDKEFEIEHGRAQLQKIRLRSLSPTQRCKL